MNIQQLKKDLETVRRALRVQDAKQQNRVSGVLKQYQDLIRALTPEQRAEAARRLNELTDPKTLEDAIERATLRNMLGGS